MSEIVALVPIFSTDPNGDRFCVIRDGNAPVNLNILGHAIAGDPDALVGLYAVEGIDAADAAKYNPDPRTYGRVLSLVRTRHLTPAKPTIWDWESGCLEFSMRRGLVDRWPAGWPSECVFFSLHGGPVLRDAWSFGMGRHDFHVLTHQFLQGPIDLRPRSLKPLRDHLMREVRHRVNADPSTMIQPF
jgi:hypothetical protein